MWVEIIVASLSGGAVASVVTAWALRRKIDAETEEIENRIRTNVLESLRSHIDFLNTVVEGLQVRIKALEEENELLRKKNGELEDRLERYEKQSDTGFQKVVSNAISS